VAEGKELGVPIALDPRAVGGVVMMRVRVGLGLELSKEVIKNGSCFGLGRRELGVGYIGLSYVLTLSRCHCFLCYY
jgi:hypothetical protein